MLFAVASDCVSVVEILLQKRDCKVNLADSDGVTPLTKAAGEGRTVILRLLLARQDLDKNLKAKRHGSSALIVAAMNGHIDVMRELLSHGVVDMESQRLNGDSAMHVSAYMGHVKAVELLLAAKPSASWNITNSRGATALDYAHLRQMNDIAFALEGAGFQRGQGYGTSFDLTYPW